MVKGLHTANWRAVVVVVGLKSMSPPIVAKGLAGLGPNPRGRVCQLLSIGL